MVFIICFFVAHWYLSLFSQTFFQHRYAAHKAFDMNKGWEKFFFVFAWITQGSSYLSPWAYGVMHRMHHAYADTELDPHSPAYDKNLVTMMWRTKNIYAAIMGKRIAIDPKFTKNVPEWRSFDVFANGWISRVLWIGVYVWIYILFAPYWWLFLLLPFHIVMGPLHGVIINWYAHKYGHVNFETSDTSKNLFRFDWLMFGEGYHNNHHVHPSRSNFAMGKGEFDLCYPIILVLQKFRIIRLAKA